MTSGWAPRLLERVGRTREPNPPPLRTAPVVGASPLAAAALARSTLDLCDVGIRARAAGWCLGEAEWHDIEAYRRALTAASLDAPSRDARRRARRHRRRGHDAWCRAIGIPEDTLHGLMRARDSGAAIGLIRERVADAVAEIAHRDPGRAWSTNEAREIVHFHVGLCVSPSPTEAVPHTGARGTASGGMGVRFPDLRRTHRPRGAA